VGGVEQTEDMAKEEQFALEQRRRDLLVLPIIALSLLASFNSAEKDKASILNEFQKVGAVTRSPWK